MSRPTSAPKTFWEFTLKGDSSDDSLFLLFDRGARGSCVAPDGQIMCYFELTPDEVTDKADEVRALGFTVEGTREYDSSVNWVQKSAGVWQKLQLKKIEIVPCTEDEGLLSPASSDPAGRIAIRIVPGGGFGTGQHASTKMALEFIESDFLAERSPQSILDVGSGSGILAIACHKLFGVKVDAIEIDEDAIENSRLNFSINGTGGNIQVFNRTLDRHPGKYDLLIANIYAEILCNLEPEFFEHIRPGGTIILSGIMSSLADSVNRYFCPPGWNLTESKTEDGWTALMLTRS